MGDRLDFGSLRFVDSSNKSNKQTIQVDSSLRLSACSFLTFLTDINNFGYNPTNRQFQEHLHYLRLIDAEVLKEVNSRL